MPRKLNGNFVNSESNKIDICFYFDGILNGFDCEQVRKERQCIERKHSLKVWIRNYFQNIIQKSATNSNL